jgi:Tfp pilus assembly ATPase PilU
VDLSQGDLFSWITSAAALGGTALYLRADAPVLARVDGKMTRVQSEVLTASAFARACAGLDGGADHAWQRNTDGSWTRDGGSLGRTTCREFSDDLGAGLVVFLQTPPPALSLHRLIPRKVKGACDGDGLVVVAASTPGDVVALGAATADWAGQRRGGYVIALRPAGTTRPHISGDFVSQREFSGSDAEIASAVHAAAAESPDVLLVAAPPSDAAMREAVHAADAGRLVIVAVLAQTSVQALRVLGGRVQAGGAAPNRLALATAFRAAFSHRVLRRLRGGQTLVQDLILGTSEVSTLLASGDLAGITRLQRSAVAGMSTVDGALARAVTRGHLSLRQAAGQAVDRGHLVTSVRAARRARANRTPLANDSDAAMLGCDDLFVPMGAKAFAGRHHAFAG